jgi:hypothetical protein
VFVNTSEIYHVEIAQWKTASPHSLSRVLWRRTWQAASIGLAILVPLDLAAIWLVPLLFGPPRSLASV